MKERPILFNAENVKAILDGSKTQTRRVVSKRNSIIGEGGDWGNLDFYAKTFLNDHHKAIMADGAEPNSIADLSLKDKGRAPKPWADNSVSPQYGSTYTWQYLHVPYRWAEEGTIYRVYPRWEVADRLWVRETWAYFNETDCDYEAIYYKADKPNLDVKWHPSIFMPRWASRITLEITGVRVERLQEINLKDTRAEGMRHEGYWAGDVWHTSTGDFHFLWDSLNTKRGYGWETNPWVWVIEFKDEQANIK